ncbi:glycosyltransferase [Candidatus Uhrbacteria bacterium]|nr:glycosyltransferase [Candidatus Uhrbacteria bacterium]
MKLTIVIPTKNEETLLPRLLQSIRAQEFQDYEIVVADAHSTDQTRTIAEAHGARVVDGGMPGPGRNRGAEAAKGEILFFMDSDVVLPEPSFLKDIVSEFEAVSAGVATLALKPMTDNVFDKFGHEFYNVYLKALESIRPHAVGTCIMARKDVHDAIGGFDEDVVFAEDMEYVQRAHEKGHLFKVMRSHPMLVSVRRLEKDGRLNVAAKYIYGEWHMITKGPFKRLPFEYKFAHFDEGDKPTE